MENGVFAPKEQMLHFPYLQKHLLKRANAPFYIIFQIKIHDISKALKGAIIE